MHTAYTYLPVTTLTCTQYINIFFLSHLFLSFHLFYYWFFFTYSHQQLEIFKCCTIIGFNAIENMVWAHLLYYHFIVRRFFYIISFSLNFSSCLCVMCIYDCSGLFSIYFVCKFKIRIKQNIIQVINIKLCKSILCSTLSIKH